MRRPLTLRALHGLMARGDVEWRTSSLTVEAWVRHGERLEAEDIDVAGEPCTRIIVTGVIVGVCPVGVA